MSSPKALSCWSLSWGTASTQIHLFPGLTLLILAIQGQWGMQGVIAHIVQWGSVLGEPDL